MSLILLLLFTVYGHVLVFIIILFSMFILLYIIVNILLVFIQCKGIKLETKYKTTFFI